jgi:hypothetical protein
LLQEESKIEIIKIMINPIFFIIPSFMVKNHNKYSIFVYNANKSVVLQMFLTDIFVEI